MRSHLSDGQRLDDIEIMIMNVAGGMADIAAASGEDIDGADLNLGEDIAERYHGLWEEVTGLELMGPDERYRIRDRIERVNSLGFDVGGIDLIPEDGGGRLRLHLAVTGRNFHRHRLRDLTGIDASENQARQILADLHHYEAGADLDRSVAAIRWRVEVFEPLLSRIKGLEWRRTVDPVQAYTDFLHHRYGLSVALGQDVPNDEAFESWLAADQPGYPIG
jgi:hypothetical protein